MAKIKWMKEYLVKFRYTVGRTITHGSAICTGGDAENAIAKFKATKEGFVLEDIHKI